MNYVKLYKLYIYINVIYKKIINKNFIYYFYTHNKFYT